MPKFFGKTRVRVPEVSGERLGRLFGFSKKPAIPPAGAAELYPEDQNTLRMARRLFFPGQEKPDEAAMERMFNSSATFQERILPYRGRRTDRAAYNYMKQTEPEHVANFLRDVDIRSVRSMARRRLKNLLWNNLSRVEKQLLNAVPERKSAFMQDAVNIVDGVTIRPNTRFEMAQYGKNTRGAYHYGLGTIRPEATINSSEAVDAIAPVHEVAGHAVDYALQDISRNYLLKSAEAEEGIKRLYSASTPHDNPNVLENVGLSDPVTAAYKKAYDQNLNEHIARVTEYALEKSQDGVDLFSRSFRYWPDDVKNDFARWMRRRSSMPNDTPLQEIVDFYSSYPELFGGGGHLGIYRKYFSK